MLECNDVPNEVEGDACTPGQRSCQNGAKWILKRGGVGYPGVHQEQGRGAQLLAR